MLFTPLQVVRDGRLRIPTYVLAHLGLHDGCTLHVSQSGDADPSKTRGIATEYVCSAVPFNRWKDVWRLSATLTDRPGLVADLSKVLELEKIDVICTRSTVLDRVRFMVDMHLDCSDYESEYDLDTSERQQNPMLGLEELQARICATLIKSIDLPFPLLPMVSLHRNHVLRSAAAQSQMTTSSTLAGC